MKKGFSSLNIIILFTCFCLGYLLYIKYYSPKIVKNNEIVLTSKEKLLDEKKEFKNIASSSIEIDATEIKKSSPLPDPKTLPNASPIVPSVNTNDKEITPPTHNGNYENKLYNYKIIFPPTWTLKDQFPENISIGTIPAKNGQGSISFRVVENLNQEIQTLKSTAKQYPSIISLKEKNVTIDNISGTEYLLINNINKMTQVYVVLVYNEKNYMIQYTLESTEFVEQVNEVLQKFKFISI